ncbi:MAG: transglycosylase domain-containing protein [Mycobacteriales bacterium]
MTATERAGGEPSGGGELPPAGGRHRHPDITPRSRFRPRWRWWPQRPLIRRRWLRRSVYSLLTILVLLVIAAGVAVRTVRLPAMPVPPQVSTLTYADGSPLATIGTQHRIEVTLDKVPEPVWRAVLAAEDRKFFAESGFSPAGIARAAWADLVGNGSKQGGSTITQQYVKNAFLSQHRTLTRKVKELILSIKLEQRHSKMTILQAYLNTVYFGRGAYGIEAAAETYFGRSATKLSLAEGALLAASIRSPALYDPQNHPDASRYRWKYVLDGMVEKGWLDPAERRTQRYPEVKPRGSGLFQENAGPAGLVIQRVRDELTANGVSGRVLGGDGVKVVTTLDPHAQQAAVAAATAATDGQPDDLRSALVAADPGTGRLLAYYGGKVGTGYDYTQSWRPPGRAFAPFVYAALYARDQMPSVLDLAAAGRKAGLKSLAEFSWALGMSRTRPDGKDSLPLSGSRQVTEDVALGRYEITPTDLLRGYATIENSGKRQDLYLVQEVRDGHGTVLYRHHDTAPAQAVAASDAYRAAASAASQYQTKDPRGLADARSGMFGWPPVEFAATASVALDKNDLRDAWSAGCAPRLCAVSWMGTDGQKPLRNAGGGSIEGTGLPTATLRAVAGAVLGPLPKGFWEPYVTIKPDGMAPHPMPSAR